MSLNQHEINRVGRIRSALDEFTYCIAVECVNGIKRAEQVVNKTHHALDAAHYFCYQTPRIPIPVVARVCQGTQLGLEHIVELGIQKAHPKVLIHALESKPRLTEPVQKNKRYPFNSDFLDAQSGGIPSWQQQCIYALIGACLKQNKDPFTVLYTPKNKQRGRSLDIDFLDDNTIRNNLRGPFLEFYVAQLYMAALDKQPYTFHYSVSFKLWEQSLLPANYCEIDIILGINDIDRLCANIKKLTTH
ncbi:MAG: hypothetical protein ACMXYC_02250 [Candidatus Woesearchaeota archaeon]